MHVYRQRPFPPPATSGLFTRVEANPNGTMNFIRKIPAGTSPGASAPTSFDQSKGSTTSHHSSFASPTLPPQGVEADDESRESTPASPPYPKAGSGLMAKLPPDDQDLDWLVDDDDYAPFSHIVYNSNGNGEKIEENGIPVGTHAGA